MSQWAGEWRGRGLRVITDNEEINPLEKIQFHRHSEREISFYWFQTLKVFFCCSDFLSVRLKVDRSLMFSQFIVVIKCRYDKQIKCQINYSMKFTRLLTLIDFQYFRSTEVWSCLWISNQLLTLKFESWNLQINHDFWKVSKYCKYLLNYNSILIDHEVILFDIWKYYVKPQEKD